MWYLEVRNLEISLKHKFILKVDSFVIRSGELVYIIGPSGSGKTTFALSLSGFIPPTKGQILFNGRQFYKEITRKGIIKLTTYVPQEILNTLPPNFTLKNLLKILFLNQKEAFLRFKEYAQLLKLKPRIFDLKFYDLSFGEKQRVALCLTLANPKKIYILDEVNAFLDICSTLDFVKLLENIIKNTDNEIGIILISHKKLPSHSFEVPIKKYIIEEKTMVQVD